MNDGELVNFLMGGLLLLFVLIGVITAGMFVYERVDIKVRPPVVSCDLCKDCVDD